MISKREINNQINLYLISLAALFLSYLDSKVTVSSCPDPIALPAITNIVFCGEAEITVPPVITLVIQTYGD